MYKQTFTRRMYKHVTWFPDSPREGTSPKQNVAGVETMANLALVYIFSSLFYLMMTRNAGTPLADSFTPEQLELKKGSAKYRRAVFWQASVLSVVLVLLWRPFKPTTTCPCR